MGDVWDGIVRFFERGTAGNPLIDLLIRTVEAFILLVVLFIAGRWAKRSVAQIAGRASRSNNLGALSGNLTYVAIIILALLCILTIYTGTGFQSLLTLLGIVSLALSLSVQDILRNLIAGTYILLEQPWKIGDTIKIRDMEGQVTSIEIRTTNIKTEANTQVIVPNGIMFTEIVTNLSTYGGRPKSIKLILPPEQTFEKAAELLKETLSKFDTTEISHQPPVAVHFDNTLDGKQTVLVEFWTPGLSHRAIATKVVLAICEALPGAEIASIG